jgi:hypothetical protein
MKSICSTCGSNLSVEEIEEGYCSECEHKFNPNHDAWVADSPEQYEGTFTSVSGKEVSISSMAEQLLCGKILKRFGLFAATTEGIECLDHYYFIDKDRLRTSDWVEHMQTKSWVNIEDFKKALEYVKNIS